ncbi:MAG: hypothetical protein ACI9VM_000070 [Candidatus Azotimanducaceae bacterium]|jgi:hypothetical protein
MVHAFVPAIGGSSVSAEKSIDSLPTLVGKGTCTRCGKPDIEILNPDGKNGDSSKNYFALHYKSKIEREECAPK